MRAHRIISLLVFSLFLINSQAEGQSVSKTRPFSLDELIDYWKNDVPCKRLTTLTSERGIDFPATTESLQQLQNAGVCNEIIQMVRGKAPPASTSRPELAEPALRGRSFLDQGKYPEAIKEFETAKANDPRNAEFLTLISKAQKALTIERSLPAEPLTLENIERLLADLTPRRLMTLVNERGLRCTPTQSLMERLIRIGMDDRLVITIEKKGLENEKELTKFVEMARSAYEQGQYALAVDLLGKSNTICPSERGILANLEQVRNAQAVENKLRPGPLSLNDVVYLLTGKVSNGRVATLVTERKVGFKTLSGDDEKRIRGAGGDIEVLTAIKSQTQAVIVQGRPLCNVAPDQQRLVNSGFEMIRQGKFDEALAIAEKVAPSVACYEKAWELQGDALRGLRRFTEAIASYDKSLAISEAEPLIWSKRGIALQDLAQHEEAVNSFEKALLINPVNLPTWVFRGESLLALKKCDDAKRSYDKALEIDPKYQLTLHKKYEALKHCGQ
jgi:tetratricopeptide (TPR) repeat protein